MITGDYHHTAIAVAKGVGMVQPGSDIVVIDTIGEAQLRSELSTLKTPQSVASHMATPNFTPQASFSSRRDSPLQQQEEQQMLFAAFEKADPDHAFEPEMLGSQPSGKHQHWDFQKSDPDYAFPPQSQEKQSQGKHQHWKDDQILLEPVYGDMQSIQDTARQSGVVGHTPQGVVALPGDASMEVQSASQLKLAGQPALSHQAAISRQQSAVSWQQPGGSQQQSALSRQQSAVSGQQPAGSQQQSALSPQQAAVSRQHAAVSWQQPGGLQQQSALSPQQSAVSRQHSSVSWQQHSVSWQQHSVLEEQSALSWQQSGVSNHQHRKLSPLTGAEKMRLKLSGQLQIPAEAPSQQQQQQQHLVGLQTVQTSGSITTVSLLHAAVADASNLDQHQILQGDDQPPITVVSKRKSWFTAMLEKFAEDESAPQQNQHEEAMVSQQVPVREPSMLVLSRLKSRLSGLLQMHTEEEEEPSRHQHGEGQMQKGPPPVTGLARMRSILAGHLQKPDLDTPLSDPPGMFSHRGRPANPLSIFIPPAAPEPSWEGLKFLTAGHQTLEASQALTALAEGQMRCAVTGDAFEHLLQHHDLSLLELVMRNVAVFSRMQPQQKGQVMDLLGIQGIHQLFNGRPRHIVVSTHPVTVS